MTSFVFVQPHLRFGGAERQTVLAANGLVARGHRVHVVLHSGDGGLVPTLRPEVDLHVLGLESHVATVEVARRLHSVLRRLPRSLVVVKLWSSILACALVDRRPGAAHHVYDYCEDLDPTDHARYIRLGHVKQRLVGAVFRSRAHLSANTETVASSMVDVYRLRRRPVVVPSTVDPDAVRRTAAELTIPRDERFTVVSVCSLVPRKGLDVTLAALEALDVPVQWHVVGVGPLARSLAERARRHDHDRVSVTLHGGLAHPYGVMAGADVLVHSARSEAWGIVLLESLAAGTPVIAAQAIGPVEMQRGLGHRPDLFELTAIGDPDDLCRRLRARVGAPKPDADDCAHHVSPFSIDRAVTLWEQRAADLLEVAS